MSVKLPQSTDRGNDNTSLTLTITSACICWQFVLIRRSEHDASPVSLWHMTTTDRQKSMKSLSAQRLYNYWQKLRGERPAPERRDIEPAAIKDLLSDVFILEHQSGAEFSYRLAGSSLCNVYCRELKGRSFREFWPEDDLEALDTMITAIRTDAAAAIIGYEGKNARGQSVPFEMLLLPLRYGGHDYPRILGVSVPTDTHYWMGVHPVLSHEVTSMRLIWPDEQPAFLRQVVNADTSLDDDLLLDRSGEPRLGIAEIRQNFRDELSLDVRQTSDSVAADRRSAFRVIDGGLS